MNPRSSKLAAFPLAAVLGVGLLAGCGDDTVVEEAEDQPVAEAAILGEPVTVQADVSEVLGPNSFVVGGETLVVGADLAAALEEGQQVQVTGTVTQFLVPQVEQQFGFGFTEEETELLVDFEDQLAIVATDVEALEIGG